MLGTILQIFSLRIQHILVERKRLRSPITPVYQNPSNCNLFNVVIPDPEPNATDDETISQVEEFSPHTREVIDKFEKILQEELIRVRKKEKNEPSDKMMIGQYQKFKVPSPSRQFSSVVQQRKCPFGHHSEIIPSRARNIWDPSLLRSVVYPPLPDLYPDTIDNTSSPFTSVRHCHNYEKFSSKSRSSTLQRSESCKTVLNRPSNSSLYPSQHASHTYIYVFMY